MPMARRLLAEAWVQRARQLRGRGDVGQAVTACRRAVTLAPSLADGHRQLAVNLQALQRHDEAIRALRHLLTLRPVDPTASHLLNALEQRSVARAPAGYVRRLFDRFAVTFDRRMNGSLNYRVPAVLGKRLRQAAACGHRFARALDLGCGTGLAGDVLRPEARHVTGVDLSPRMLRQAQSKGIYDTLECDDILRFLKRCRPRYDLIVAADVFIYIGDLAPVFRLVDQRLTDTGIFALSIERTTWGPYRLTKSGRFAHSVDYIRRLAEANRLVIMTRDKLGLRMEHHRWINGDLFLLVRPSSNGPADRRSSRPWWRAWFSAKD